MADNTQQAAFVSPFTPRYREVFYSSIPVSWEDLPDYCITCLPCARDTFEPPSRIPPTVDGQVIV